MQILADFPRFGRFWTDFHTQIHTRDPLRLSRRPAESGILHAQDFKSCVLSSEIRRKPKKTKQLARIFATLLGDFYRYPVVLDLEENWTTFFDTLQHWGSLRLSETHRRNRLTKCEVEAPWEGSLGGFASAVAAALVFGLVFDLGVPAWQQAVIGGVVGVVGQWGDLIESKLKRIADLKDAGSIIPGHGGLLDRLDSILLTLPAVYYLIVTVFVP